MTTTYWLLALAIIAEVAATLSLKASNGLSVLFPSLVVIVGYGIAFVALSVVVKTLPLGITYAIWTGIGTLLITLLASALYQQQLDLAALIGMAFIIVGTLIIQLFSKTNGVH
jgi:small multidrug resistance pump